MFNIAISNSSYIKIAVNLEKLQKKRGVGMLTKTASIQIIQHISNSMYTFHVYMGALISRAFYF